MQRGLAIPLVPVLLALNDLGWTVPMCLGVLVGEVRDVVDAAPEGGHG